jgi:hypothetical protein
MRLKIYFAIAWRIVLLFATGILFSYFPDYLRKFFNDIYIPEGLKDYQVRSPIDMHYIWGIRHYWYFWMCVFLFILSVINLILIIRKILIKEYPSLN